MIFWCLKSDQHEFFPPSSDKSKRRTKVVPKTSEPVWNQAFAYSPLKPAELHKRALEISVWSYDRIGGGEFLGEVLIDLTSAKLNDELLSFHLNHPDAAPIPAPVSRMLLLLPSSGECKN